MTADKRAPLPEITVIRTDRPGPLPTPPLGYGGLFTDHIATLRYTPATGWSDPRIVPFGEISVHPAASGFQYAQSVFDAFKAHVQPDGSLAMFRPQKHIERFRRSAERMCIPPVDDDLLMALMQRLCDLDRRFAPTEPGSALNIRPTVIGTEGNIALRPAQDYLLMVLLSPVGDYYAEGNNPVKILASDTFVRSVRGGVGSAKTGGNYAASMYAAQHAAAEGYTQILWLDGVERRWLEEVGSMNIFVKINGEIRTPPLSDSILPGVTRDTILTILREEGAIVSEAPVSIEEIFAAAEAGTLEEVWGTGTAAIVSSVGLIGYRGQQIVVGGGERGPLTRHLYDKLLAVQKGRSTDPHGWRVTVPQFS